jgi:hypothetical protein
VAVAFDLLRDFAVFLERALDLLWVLVVAGERRRVDQVSQVTCVFIFNSP